MTTYISVCKNVILSNLKHGKNDPPIRVSKGKHGKPDHCWGYEYENVKIKYSPKKPMPWGARVWIELK